MLGSKSLKIPAEEEEVDLLGLERGIASYGIVNGGEAAMAATLYSYLGDILSHVRY